MIDERRFKEIFLSLVNKRGEEPSHRVSRFALTLIFKAELTIDSRPRGSITERPFVKKACSEERRLASSSCKSHVS